MRCPTLLLLSALPCLSADPASKLIIPGGKQGAAPSIRMASSTRPASLQSLGPLAEQVFAYFAMDDPKTGGLTWSRGAISLYPTLSLAAKTEGPATYLDFSALHSKLTISPALKLSSHFTLTAWVQTPGPTKAAAIWQGAGGDYLTLKENQVLYWTARTGKWGVWAQSPDAITGWHHVALVGNAHKVQAFLDGQPLAVVEELDMPDLSTIGNHRSPDADHEFMAAGIDEQVFFARNLTPAEIVTVMNATKPGAAGAPKH